MLPLLALTGVALLATRVAAAPAGSWRFVLAGALALGLAGQLLPAGHPWRVGPGELRGLGWAGLWLAPVAAYALLLRHLRRRARAAVLPAPGASRHPVGLVRIEEDAALAAETAAELAAAGPAAETFSLGWRSGDGALVGHLRLALQAGVGDVEQVVVAPGHRRQGIGRRLLGAAADLARERGARRLAAQVASWHSPGFFRACGFAAVVELPLEPGGATRAWFVREIGPEARR